MKTKTKHKKTLKPMQLFKTPIALVQIKRCGKWFDVLWLNEGDKCSEVILAKELGPVEGVRVKSLSQRD